MSLASKRHPGFHGVNNQLVFSEYTTQTMVDEEGTLKALFFAHSLSLELLSRYHTVLFLDCTYKTNKYNMPLLHIAGVSGNNDSFSAGFCFLASETHTYYEWALNTLQSFLTANKIPPPEVMITDRELALMNAISKIFPNTKNMLCTWHIEKNLVANASKLIKDQFLEHRILKDWSNLIRLPTISKFESHWNGMRSNYPPAFMSYIEKTWIPHAPSFADAWTKKITHFDHRTSSRIESSHKYIKQHLLSSNANFPEVIKLITLALESQHHEITSRFHQQKITTLRDIVKIFSPCLGKITHFALRRAQNNFNRLKQDPQGGMCNRCHTIRTGIPCKHWILDILNKGQKVEPQEFHSQWHIMVRLFHHFLCSFYPILSSFPPGVIIPFSSSFPLFSSPLFSFFSPFFPFFPLFSFFSPFFLFFPIYFHFLGAVYLQK